jgi:hypothetical protein
MGIAPIVKIEPKNSFHQRASSNSRNNGMYGIIPTTYGSSVSNSHRKIIDPNPFDNSDRFFRGVLKPPLKVHQDYFTALPTTQMNRIIGNQAVLQTVANERRQI